MRCPLLPFPLVTAMCPGLTLAHSPVAYIYVAEDPPSAACDRLHARLNFVARNIAAEPV